MHICMVLDESGYREMFEIYLRIASEDADDEGSDHDSEMDTEVTDDTDSGEYDSQATISEKDNEPVRRKHADADGVWWVEQGEREEEEEEEYIGYEDEDEEGANPVDDQPTPAAQGKRVRPPKNQEFPAMPPHSLSADKKREWTFRRNRKYQPTPPTIYNSKIPHHLTIALGIAEIQALVDANTDPNTKLVDKAAALADWNSSSTPHPRTHRPNSLVSNPYKNYSVLTDRYVTLHTNTPLLFGTLLLISWFFCFQTEA